MKFKSLILATLMFIGLGTAANAQDYTLSRNSTATMGDMIFEGSFTISGDSTTLSAQGLVTSNIKDFAVGTIGIVTGTSVFSDTLVLATYGEWPSQIRIKSVDSLATKYSNYIDISTINDKSEPIYVWAKRVALTANTSTIYIAIRRSKLDYIPERFLNSK